MHWHIWALTQKCPIQPADNPLIDLLNVVTFSYSVEYITAFHVPNVRQHR